MRTQMQMQMLEKEKDVVERELDGLDGLECYGNAAYTIDRVPPAKLQS